MKAAPTLFSSQTPLTTDTNIAVGSARNRPAKRLHDPTLSDRAFAIFFLVTILVVLTLILAPGASAGTKTYDGGPASTGTALNTAANWSGDTLPTTSDEALFTTVPSTAATFSVGNTSPIYGDLIWNQNTSSNITGSNGTRIITLSGGGGSSAAIANGGATGDLIVLGTSATTNTLTIGSLGLSLAISANGNFDVVNSGATLNIAGILSGAFNLTKTGAGTLTLSGNNTFGAGKTFTLSGGTLNINSATALGAGTFQINGGTTINNTSGGAIIISNNNPLTINGDFTFTGTNSLNLGTGAATLGTASGTSRTITVGANTLTVGSAISNGTTANSLTKAGNGTLVLSGANTYTGATTVNTGTLSVGTLANGGSNSNIGASTNAATNLVLNGGTLQYTGAAQSTDRLFSVGTNGGTIDASGSGALNFTNTGSMGSNSQTGTRTLILTGTNTGNNTLAAIVGDHGGATSLTKSGAGTWVLSGTSTYSGQTTVSGGMLGIGSNSALGASTVALQGGTIFASGGARSISNDMFISAGNGTIGGSHDLTLNGTLTNFNSNRTLTVNNTGITTQAGSVFLSESDATTRTLTINDTGNTTISGVIANNSGGNTLASNLTYSGSGTLTLSGANTYGTAGVTGTTVTGGTLLVNNTTGSGTGFGNVLVNNTGTLCGTGTISGSVTVASGGIHNPGPGGPAGTAAAVGTLRTGALTLQSGSLSSFDVSAVTNYDQVISSGALTFGGTLDVNIANGFTFTWGDTLTLFSGSSTSSTFSGIADGQDVIYDGYLFKADYTPTGFDLVAVPEPSTWICGALVAGLIGWSQRRRFVRVISRAV